MTLSGSKPDAQTRIAAALEGILAELKKGYVVVPKGYSVVADNADWRPALERIADTLARVTSHGAVLTRKGWAPLRSECSHDTAAFIDDYRCGQCGRVEPEKCRHEAVAAGWCSDCDTEPEPCPHGWLTNGRCTKCGERPFDDNGKMPCPKCGVALVCKVVDSGGFCGKCGWEGTNPDNQGGNAWKRDLPDPESV